MTNSRTDWRPAASWQGWLGVSALVSFFALLDAVHTHAGLLAEGSAPVWSETLGMTAIFWLAYAAFIPPVMLIAGRYPLDRRRPQTVLIHLSAALAFTYVHIIAISFLFAPFRPAPQAFVPLVGRLVRLNFGINFLTYWAVVSAMHARRYYAESRRRELTSAQLDASLTAARLEALRAKLNPHFLFNTLNAISVLALTRQHTAVVDGISRLSDLLRVSLDDALPQQTPLSQELTFLGGYLDIVRLRFGDRMVVEQHVAAETLDALVPSMILQPLVENAVVHGISMRVGEGRIAIDARRMDGTLYLQVSDNGPGFGALTTRGQGIGLRNTRARLEQIHGAAQALDLSDAPGGGAVVRITIPFTTAGELAISA